MMLTPQPFLAGFMSNRGRQNVASYLVLDMAIDWRKGADWFESVLQDYDVASNWGNWVSAAGMTGGRVSHFNPLKQSKVTYLQEKYKSFRPSKVLSQMNVQCLLKTSSSVGYGLKLFVPRNGLVIAAMTEATTIWL